jgi:hypothetical protein
VSIKLIQSGFSNAKRNKKMNMILQSPTLARTRNSQGDWCHLSVLNRGYRYTLYPVFKKFIAKLPFESPDKGGTM